MPFTYHIDKERRRVISTGSGVLTSADIVNHQTELSADPDFCPDFDTVADFSKVTKVEATSATVQGAARRSLFSRNSRIAAVATNDEAYGLLRMYAAFREMSGGQAQMKTFRSREEAINWLDTGNAK